MAHKGFLSRLRTDASGNVLAISAAAMIPMTIMVGSALDLSVSYMARGKLQNACDAAALAARQSMVGVTFDKDVEAEGQRFFDFNFPTGTAGTENASFTLTQDSSDPAQVNGSASAEVQTSLVRVIGVDEIDISVDCDAIRDLGFNDVMLVLDVTGSMNNAPSNGPGTKIQRLREGAMGLYRALQGAQNAETRYGLMPYSHTVNVARSLRNPDILVDQKYVDGKWTYQLCDTNGYSLWNCVTQTSNQKPISGFGISGFINGGTQYVLNAVFTPNGTKNVNIADSGYIPGGGATVADFRNSGEGCIEERSTIDPLNPVPSGTLEIRDYVTVEDINERAKNAKDYDLKFGRYDPSVQNGYIQTGCPSEAQRLKIYPTEGDFQTAIDTATARVTGGTYHDLGMVWGARFLSRDGMFSGNNYGGGDNAKTNNGQPVNMHLIFMTDGLLDVGAELYSAMGVEKYTKRLTGTGTARDKHIARFESACDRAKEMGMTIWVIALDVVNVDDIKPCATSDNHFYTSDGSDLEQVFANIGQGIGKLRLVK